MHQHTYIYEANYCFPEILRKRWVIYISYTWITSILFSYAILYTASKNLRVPIRTLLWWWTLYGTKAPRMGLKTSNNRREIYMAQRALPSRILSHRRCRKNADCINCRGQWTVKEQQIWAEMKYCEPPPRRTAPSTAGTKRFFDLDESAGNRSYFRPVHSVEDNRRISLGASALGSGGLLFHTVWLFYNFYHLTNTVLRRKRLFLFSLFILINHDELTSYTTTKMSTSLQIIISISLFTVSFTLSSVYCLHKNNNSIVRARCAPRLEF